MGREEQNVRGLKRDPSNVWSLVRIHASLLASVSNMFCNYPTRLKACTSVASPF